jgi:hypothetical protein
MSHSIVHKMKAWVEHNAASLLANGVTVEFVEAPAGDLPSARIDFETPELYGRATAWASGLCDFEVISVESTEQVMWNHLEGVDAENIGKYLTDFAGKLSLEARQKLKPS